MTDRPVEPTNESAAVANADNDRIVVTRHRSGPLDAAVVWYWADYWGTSPSDSCRMFWPAR